MTILLMLVLCAGLTLDLAMIPLLSGVLLFKVLALSGGFYDGAVFSDRLSMSMCFVSCWVFLFSLLCVGSSSTALAVYWAMQTLTLASFATEDYVMFYASFELVFLLMFFFLLGWGKSAERLQASFYMLFYTLAFSMPFIMLLVEYKQEFSGVFFLLPLFKYQGGYWALVLLVFSVKLPLFGVHMWLPKAHVEAPVSASMLLAGVLLKLGGYGLMRFAGSLEMNSVSQSVLLPGLVCTALIGALYLSSLCSRLSDLKSMIAYSSVVHMSVAFVGLFTFSEGGVSGALLMMVAHGFISPLLFYLMNLFYESAHSRSTLVLKGGLLTAPLVCMAWFLGCFLNLGLPPFMPFFAEILVVGSLSALDSICWATAAFCCFFTGVYCTLMYSSLSHGSAGVSAPLSLNHKQMTFVFCHLFFILVFPSLSLM